MRVGLAQNSVQGCDNGHAQFTKQSQDVAPGTPAKDAVFELQTCDIHIVNIQEVGGTAIRFNVLLRQFKSNPTRVGVTAFDVVDGQSNACRIAVFGGDGLA